MGHYIVGVVELHRFCREEVGKRKLYELKLVQTRIESIKVIRENLNVARDRQKNYVENHRRT